MNDRALAKVETSQTAMAEWKAMQEQARVLVDSRFLPSGISTPEKCVAVMMTGRELGIPPMEALRSIHIIEGKPTLAASLMQRLVYQRMPNATLDVVETSDQRCVVEAARPGKKVVRFVWTLERAKKANLTGKKIWQSYPGDMLRNRCISEACRAVFPDAISGCYTPEELDGDRVAAQDLGAPVPSMVTETKPAEKAPEQIPDWVEALVAEYEAVDSEEKLTLVVRNTIAQLKECGGTDLERGTLNRARADAKKRIAEAKPPETPTEPPTDDNSADPEAREAEADGCREDFE